ncbi:MAG: hypothetical protein ACM33T_06270 [Solirubrobacterales bacterium]
MLRPDARLVLVLMVLAILGTAIALFRQGALGWKGMTAVFIATLGLGSFLFWTLIPPG